MTLYECRVDHPGNATGEWDAVEAPSPYVAALAHARDVRSEYGADEREEGLVIEVRGEDGVWRLRVREVTQWSVSVEAA